MADNDIQARELARQMLKRHEGYRQFVYRDSRGILTVGIGLNLETDGLEPEEADWLLMRRIQRYVTFLSQQPFWASLNDARKAALIDMAFELGDRGFDGFEHMIGFLNEGDYTSAAHAMIQSDWAQEEAPDRAREDARIMMSGAMSDVA